MGEGFETPTSAPSPTFKWGVGHAAESSSSKAAVPGALFEDKPQSANDAWRKLHSDPLLLIRQRELEALARIKNNPIRMAMIRKSIYAGRTPDCSKARALCLCGGSSWKSW
ncbi:hypothetical protein IEQ34_016852 [Dendrobium chrysotoxum]|uniref:Uncharacterized protein n=1 Tax=Dendrobium chrysotoxum TaxID=161865 RepID=A0AAV7GGY6_DENCH|nr:hypothetical protein IEQ34_016852 [Dendrobium chrysotoxum]